MNNQEKSASSETDRPRDTQGCSSPSPCWAHSPAPSDLWKACAQVIREEGKPLEIWRVAKATGQTESEIIDALIRESRGDMAVSFRFPPLPRAAITHLDMPNTKFSGPEGQS